MKVICVVLFIAAVNCATDVPDLGVVQREERIIDPYRIERRPNYRRIRIEEEPINLSYYGRRLIDPRFDGRLPIEMYDFRFPHRIDRINHRPRIFDDIEYPEFYRPSRKMNLVEDFVLDRQRLIDRPLPIVRPQLIDRQLVHKDRPKIVPFGPRIEDVDPVLWNMDIVPPLVNLIGNRH